MPNKSVSLEDRLAALEDRAAALASENKALKDELARSKPAGPKPEPLYIRLPTGGLIDRAGNPVFLDGNGNPGKDANQQIVDKYQNVENSDERERLIAKEIGERCTGGGGSWGGPGVTQQVQNELGAMQIAEAQFRRKAAAQRGFPWENEDQ